MSNNLDAAISQLKGVISSLETNLTRETVVSSQPNPATKKDSQNSNPSKQKPQKPSKPSSTNGSSASSVNEAEENFTKCFLQVGHISEIEAHPNSEKLFVCKVETSPGNKLQVITGLQKFYSSSELANRKVVLICNLKTAKLAGYISEAMILAGSVSLTEGTEIVKVLDPPVDSEIGDRVFLEAGSASETFPKQLSSKIWEKIVSGLKVQGGKATYNGKKLVTSKGDISVIDLPDGAEIH